MFNRKLKRRIQSLEEELGLAYSPKEGEGYAKHTIEEWGWMSKIKEVWEERQKKKEERKK